MTSLSQNRVAIVRTERGLTIAGTRITLYDVMDYVSTQYPKAFIRSLLNLTENQVNFALAYIEANRSEIEAEYQLVLKQAEKNQKYWEERNREHFDRSLALPSRPGREHLRKKLQEQKVKHEVEV
ncbi:DUF433 domain-containing protein [cf. Phormidesmis sp. LEGE 11477]|uniref:DUF433 domain-containing protein n=1 Tax=cf. Phormidesmis sp. LEGE 11477 TaxID=1828680 RepID=UPI001881BD63|nr:DUF433 domain-containing protein [cf. Phormidesmis sp. LEGE 11477]MBE9059420.1 DUF433 domain-containing protein [cf. Phormidesmis sp. LEGE 11477]